LRWLSWNLRWLQVITVNLTGYLILEFALAARQVSSGAGYPATPLVRPAKKSRAVPLNNPHLYSRDKAVRPRGPLENRKTA
jgi:hypothetical protein